MTTHSPLPFIIIETRTSYSIKSARGRQVCCIGKKEFGNSRQLEQANNIKLGDAELIVRAVNSHQSLVDALGWAMSNIRKPNRIKGQNDDHCDGYEKALLALARGEAV